jgi:hypothetical protein
MSTPQAKVDKGAAPGCLRVREHKGETYLIPRGPEN